MCSTPESLSSQSVCLYLTMTDATMKRAQKIVRILIDTNVLISGLFFGGLPKRLLSELDENFNVCVNEKIVDEYNKNIDKKNSNPNIR